MASGLSRKWGALDTLLQKMRFSRTARFVGNGEVLVDLGCGTGSFLEFIEPRVKRGVGIDGFVESQKLSNKIEIIKGDLNELLPFEEDSIDCVTAMAMIEHLENIELLIGEVHRVLKPGGKFIFTTPAPAGKWFLEFLAFKLGVISKEDIADHKHYYSKTDIEEMSKEFSSIEYFTFQFGLNQLVCLVK